MAARPSPLDRTLIVGRLAAVAALLTAASCGGSRDVLTGPGTGEGPGPVAQVSLSPSSGSIVSGQTFSFVATATDAAGTTVPNAPLAWTSSDTTVATVAAGVATGRQAGSATISATATAAGGQVRAAATLTVTPVPVASVTVAPAQDTLAIGQSVQLTAAAKDVSGAALTGRPVVWTSSDTTVALVSSAGVVTALKVGTAIITVTSGALSATAAVTVTVTAVASVVQTSVAAGYTVTCAISTGGGAFCWGVNTTGSVGNGQLGSSVPILSPSAVTGGYRFKAIFASGNAPGSGATVCALTSVGQAYCWGPTIGSGPIPARPVPTLISSTLTFTTLSVGTTHACGITGDQKLYCWGSNSYGQLMTGSSDGSGSTQPVQGLPGTRIGAVAAGAGFTCAVTMSGSTLCAGVDNWNQLGTATAGGTCNGFACSATPLVLGGGGSLSSVSAGYDFACGLDNAGSAYCWGHNALGQLGVGQPTGSSDARASLQPVAGGRTFTVLSASEGGACARTPSGAIYCWGGNNNQSPQGTPALVIGAPPLVSVSTGAEQACGADTQGQLWCWGGNTYGELGDGTTAAHYTAAVVPNFAVSVP